MILYHTSDQRIEHPDISYSRAYLDFGKGFYTTPSRLQAEKYAKRFFKEERPAFLNIFELDDDVEGYTPYTFEARNSWDGSPIRIIDSSANTISFASSQQLQESDVCGCYLFCFLR